MSNVKEPDMNCTFDKELLSAYFDGELDSSGKESEKESVESHISTCSGCLRELGEIKAAARFVTSLPGLRAPRSVAEGVSRGIAAAEGSGAGKGTVLPAADRFGRRLYWGVAAAAVLLVTMSVYQLMPNGNQPLPDTTAMKPESAPVSAKKKPKMRPAPLAGNFDEFNESSGED